MTYDVVAVLGNGYTNDWQTPEHIENLLASAADLLKRGATKEIAVAGKWSLHWARRDVFPPYTEATSMARILREKFGVSPDNILLEENSLDTIGNAIYLKRVFDEKAYRNICIACSEAQRERAAYIFSQLLPEYSVHFLTAAGPTIEGQSYNQLLQAQQELLEKQKPFILELAQQLKAGKLRTHLYDLPYYIEQTHTLDAVALAAMGGTRKEQAA